MFATSYDGPNLPICQPTYQTMPANAHPDMPKATTTSRCARVLLASAVRVMTVRPSSEGHRPGAA